ncbi:FixH family protein [Maribacter sp. PR1]|uniref:FixH family protein n=1 Tax=Maribacter cobaltidurans TaxID=1178778 RepID=A0ABU7IPM2_9FLAO|nr:MULTISPECIES: FixH family protein [Maribacter]MDC6387505.1 FixH family protein [Maribacter sp. PR1]MEE1974892.1 FixH family protein [Maribacter cobaltidurans]
MKINWGTGIVLAFIGFISFIMFFVIKMNSDRRANHDLVTEDYYRQELAYQKEIDAQNNATNDIVNLELKKQANGLQIVFPKNLDPNKIQGTVSLYRPSNKQLDFDLPISLSNNHLLIPDKRLLDGRWDIKVNWVYNGKEYLHKENITY